MSRRTYHTLPCHGYNPRTRRRVGTRHRWGAGSLCVWCGRFRDDVRRVDDVGRDNPKDTRPFWPEKDAASR